MNYIRSILFNLTYIFGSLIVSLLLLWTFLLPTKYCAIIVSEVYGGFVRLAARYVMGIKLEMRGMENLPKDSRFIIAGKHQSAFETLTIPFMRQLGYPVIVHKKELFYLPIWGMFLYFTGQIGIDRKSGIKAMHSLSKGARRAIASGRNLIIFPQGTRVTPGATAPYKPGLAKIYKDLQIPIVPMALNSGVLWGRNSFIKKSGTIVFEFLPPIPAGLPPLEATAKMEEAIETASNKLLAA